MEYRKFEKTGIDLSLLGFGCMRFPTDEKGKIDRKLSCEMISLAYKSGVNYFDTAYVYHGGESEDFLGEALAEYDRSSFYLATKLPYWHIKSLEDAGRVFETQLKRLKTDYIDFYLIHSLNINQWKRIVRLGVIDFAADLKKKGRIKYLGFSFHDEYPSFEEIIRSRDWDFCQLQLNYMDTEHQAGIKGYRLAEELGVPVIIMEPVKGGRIANLPENLLEELRNHSPGDSPSSWALRWAGSFQNVKVVLSGMSTIEQTAENIKTLGDFKPLSETDMKFTEGLAAKLRKRVNNPCSKCGYCMPCPAGVDIPQCFRIWNDFGIYRNKDGALWSWSCEIDEEQKPSACVDCGKCEEVCPQSIEIRKELQTLNKVFSELQKVK